MPVSVNAKMQLTPPATHGDLQVAANQPNNSADVKRNSSCNCRRAVSEPVVGAHRGRSRPSTRRELHLQPELLLPPMNPEHSNMPTDDTDHLGDAVVANEAALHALYPPPRYLQIQDRLDRRSRQFIAHSPLLIIGSARPSPVCLTTIRLSYPIGLATIGSIR
jgi:hypothetical protein